MTNRPTDRLSDRRFDRVTTQVRGFEFRECIHTIKGGSRRAEKSRKVLMMMMKAAKLGLAGPGAGQEQGWSKARAGLKHEQGRT